MGIISTAFPTSLKVELARALHNWDAVTGDDFWMALIKPTPSINFGEATANYSDLGADEVIGIGYTAGGFDFTPAENITPDSVLTAAFWGWSINPSWTGVTLNSAGCLGYNLTKGGRSTYVGFFGATESVTAGTFTILMPVTDQDNAILRLV